MKDYVAILQGYVGAAQIHLSVKAPTWDAARTFAGRLAYHLRCEVIDVVEGNVA